MSRYIDADLIEYYTNNYCEDIVRKEQIEAIPTADVRENVHAEWVMVKGSDGKDYRKCTNCLHTQEITGVLEFCPICGAEMRGTITASDTKGGWDGEYYLEDC